jgi:hypothetical protein
MEEAQVDDEAHITMDTHIPELEEPEEDFHGQGTHEEDEDQAILNLQRPASANQRDSTLDDSNESLTTKPTSSLLASQRVGGKWTIPLGHSEEWRMELERVGPLLKGPSTLAPEQSLVSTGLAHQQRDWRIHLDQMLHFQKVSGIFETFYFDR